MIMKQIDKSEVIPHLTEGKKVCCIDFGDKSSIGNTKAIDCNHCTIDEILHMARVTGNLFFEKESEDE